MKHNNKWSWSLYFKGAAMGIADVIPGVSGGTIALLLGIYEQFINSLSSLNTRLVVDAFQGKFDSSLVFLINLGVGIATAILLGAKLIHYCLGVAPEFVWGIFFVLVIVSLVILLKKEKLSFKSYCLFLIGGVLAYFLNQLTPQDQTITALHIFVGGFFAIFAMMLPGVSGSFLLLVMGLYEHIIGSLKNIVEIASIKTLCILGGGAFAGLFLGSRFLKWLLLRFRHETLMVLLGFMLGSSPKLWPWQKAEFVANTYNLMVIFIMLVSAALFYYFSSVTDLNESESRNKI